MATGGLTTALPAGGADITPENPTKPEAPWSSTASEKYKVRFWKHLRHLFQKRKLTDVMLPADRHSIPCHKVLLAAASKFFHDKFVVHSESLEHNRLDIEGIDFDTLKAIVSFVYNWHFELTLEKTEKLIPASISLMLPELTNTCKDFLMHQVNNDTSACIKIYSIAKTNSLTEIADEAWQVMLRNFQELSKDNAHREMSETDLRDYIRDEELTVSNENPVFEAAVSWVKHDIGTRESSFERLMKDVKLAHCCLQFLGEVVRKEPLVNTAGCLQHVSDALYHHATSPKQSGTPRRGSSIKAKKRRKPTKTPTPWSTVASNMYKARVWKYFRQMFEQDELTDVMLAPNGQSIPCHRVLLAAASNFFSDKFIVNPGSLEHNLLDIDFIDFATLTDIVHFVYNGCVELTVKKTEKLIPASVSLMLPELTNMCKDFLLHQLDDDQSACIDIYRIAKHNSLEKAAENAWDLMTEHFQEVSKHDAFKGISQTDLQDYISDERLCVANENPVFKAVVTWVRHNVENRKSSFEKLMENVNLSHCSKQFLNEVVRTEELMQTANTCLRHLSDALCHHMTSPQQFDTARRGYYTHFTPIAVYDDNAYTFKAWESEWITNTSSAGKMLRYSSACMTGDGVVITGGYDGSKYSTQCWKLTLPIMKWTALPGNQIYVLGGCNNNKRHLASVEYLDEQHKPWQVTRDIPSVLYAHTAVTYKQLIYVFGGYTSSGSSLATFMLDTVNKKWSRKADMPGKCIVGSSVVYGNRIYVLGGWENCCMSYGPDQDRWKSHCKPAVNHNTPSTVVWKDRILLCGGHDTSVIEEYNPDTDTWSQWKHQLPKSAYRPPVVFASNR